MNSKQQTNINTYHEKKMAKILRTEKNRVLWFSVLA
jgi:hypothetical protein